MVVLTSSFVRWVDLACSNDLQIEEEQNAMQARLEEEEANKAALVERINRLTRLILVSTQDVRDGSTTKVNCFELILLCVLASFLQKLAILAHGSKTLH